MKKSLSWLVILVVLTCMVSMAMAAPRELAGKITLQQLKDEYGAEGASYANGNWDVIFPELVPCDNDVMLAFKMTYDSSYDIVYPSIAIITESELPTNYRPSFDGFYYDDLESECEITPMVSVEYTSAGVPLLVISPEFLNRLEGLADKTGQSKEVKIAVGYEGQWCWVTDYEMFAENVRLISNLLPAETTQNSMYLMLDYYWTYTDY